MQAYRSAQSNQFFQDLIGPDYSHVSFSNRTPAQRRRDNADIATRTIPGLSDLRDFKEAIQGHDQFTNEPISIGQRIVTAGAGFIPFVSGRTLRGLFQTESIDTHTVRDFQISQQHTRQIDVLPNRHVISQIDTLGNPSGQLGRQGETIASEITGAVKNTQKFIVNGRTVIPDQVLAYDIATRAANYVVEVKNKLYQAYTRQLRDLETLVGTNGQVDVYLPLNAKVSGPLQKSFNDPFNPLTRQDL